MSQHVGPPRRLLMRQCLRLASALVACGMLWAPRVASQGPPAISRGWFTPIVVPDSYTQPVRFEAQVTGVPSTVAFEYNGADRAMVDDGTQGDVAAGDGIWTIQFSPNEIVGKLTPAWVYRPFIGYAKLDGQRKQNVVAEIWTPAIGLVDLRPIDATSQQTDYVANYVANTPTTTSDYQALATRFYSSHHGDSFDFVNFVHVGSRMQLSNSTHIFVKNDVAGIGLGNFDSSSLWGSQGRLKGANVNRSSIVFDTAGMTFNHETGHQWINFINGSLLSSGIPHWPKGNVAANVMGFSIPPTGQGGTFPWTFTPNGLGGYVVTFTQLDPSHSAFNSMELYLMGLVPPGIPDMFFVLNDQTTNLVHGQVLLASEITPVSPYDLIAADGPRVPDSSTSQKSFRVATILLSDALLDPYAMSLYDWFARRAEYTVPLRCSTGLFSDYPCLPFYVATGGRATMASKINLQFTNLPELPGPAVRAPRLPPVSPPGGPKESVPGAVAPRGPRSLQGVSGR